MDFSLTKEQVRLKAEVRSFLEKEVTHELVNEIRPLFAGPAASQFRRKMGAKGWLTPTWRKQYGGLERSNIDRLITADERDYYGAFEVPVGPHLAGPVILLFGNDQQKREWLPKIARGEITFSEGFTEPDAGSDLASLRTRAVKDGDDFVINGQKRFNTFCHFADYDFICARTNPDAPKHKGISLFIVDLRSPWITIRPLSTLSGHRTNELFYDDVRVPSKNMVGERDLGFYAAVKWLELANSLSVTRGMVRAMERLVEYAREARQNGELVAKDPLVRRKLGQLAIEIEIGRLMTYRLAWEQDQQAVSPRLPPLLKVYRSELLQRLSATAMNMLGLYGPLQKDSKWAQLNGEIELRCRESLRATIGGGTSEMQRRRIAERGLGFPRGD